MQPPPGKAFPGPCPDFPIPTQTPTFMTASSATGLITPEHLSAAIVQVREMPIAAREHLAQDIFRAQPTLMAMVLVQQRFGASMQEVEGLMTLLMIAFCAARDTGRPLLMIGEVHQQTALTRANQYLRALEGASPGATAPVTRAYVDGHAEKALLAFVLKEIEQEGFAQASDAVYGKLVLTALGLVEGVAMALQQ